MCRKPQVSLILYNPHTLNACTNNIQGRILPATPKEKTEACHGMIKHARKRWIKIFQESKCGSLCGVPFLAGICVSGIL
jgi:hypothetical protein